MNTRMKISLIALILSVFSVQGFGENPDIQPRVLTLDEALELAGAGELFAPGSRELHAVLAEYSRLSNSPLPRNFAPWLDRVLHLRDRHSGVEWLTRSVTISLTPVFAIGAGAKEFEGEYNALELHGKLRRALGLGPRP